jgi:hypothetical protein
MVLQTVTAVLMIERVYMLDNDQGCSDESRSIDCMSPRGKCRPLLESNSVLIKDQFVVGPLWVKELSTEHTCVSAVKSTWVADSRVSNSRWGNSELRV